jgi:cytoplasmic iron level regulating protein YaaA (DUF328/UPF0246 family)
MDLIILACSNRKKAGGVTSYMPSDQLSKFLSQKSLDSIMKSRAKIAAHDPVKFPSGPDLDTSSRESTLGFLPAYVRYSGIVYEYGNVAELYPRQSKFRLVIISALYGLLDGEDLIRDYDLMMDEKVYGQKLYTWWKQHSLGKIVEEYILSFNPGVVYDFLPIKYQDALRPWPSKKIAPTWKTIDCSGKGQGSSYYRGMEIRKLLSF